MKLYVNPISPFCRAAAIYLDEKSAQLETAELTTGSERALLLEISPRGEVPVLDTGRGVVARSRSICDFADLEYPEPALVPSDPIAHVVYRQLEDVACSITDALQFVVHLVSSRRPNLVEGVHDLSARRRSANTTGSSTRLSASALRHGILLPSGRVSLQHGEFARLHGKIDSAAPLFPHRVVRAHRISGVRCTEPGGRRAVGTGSGRQPRSVLRHGSDSLA